LAGGKLKKKYHLVRWDNICKEKKKGGIGLKDLRNMNVSPFCKWWWLLETSEGVWQDIVHLKYVRNYPICSIPNKINDFRLWKDLMKIRYIYLGAEVIS
jgi:hypothetical protein